MTILVLSDDGNGTATVRERREIFDPGEFRHISYACPDCGNEFTFQADTEPVNRWKACPICNADLKVAKTEVSHPEVLLWEALKLFRDFSNFVNKHKDVPPKLVV